MIEDIDVYVQVEYLISSYIISNINKKKWFMNIEVPVSSNTEIFSLHVTWIFKTNLAEGYI